ncbi:MAG TPA: tripartite tricarboxylate transporter substrate binding protein [Burkholderiales bacterium]|nr:tripartite tricarboxylate transporter substrate binding protein [Burkholderiales bacterium]
MNAIRFILSCTLLAALAPITAAQDYPVKAIRLVIPFEAGGTVDALGRVVTNQIIRQSGMRIVIDNKPGANSMIGTTEVAKAAPDGYTVLCVSPSIVLNPLINKNVPYDVGKSFVPITAIGIGAGYLLVVRQELPVNSVKELIALARRSEKSLTYGTPGIGNALHVASESFAHKVAVTLLHVPYKGSASALAAIAAGQVDLMLLSPATVVPFVQAGKVRPIAFTGTSRSQEFPNVPTMQEAGVDDFVIKGTWVGWFVPSGTSPKIVNRLADEVSKAVKNPQVAASLAAGGFDPDGRAPAEFARFVSAESQRFGDVLKNARIELH